MSNVKREILTYLNFVYNNDLFLSRNFLSLDSQSQRKMLGNWRVYRKCMTFLQLLTIIHFIPFF